MTAAAGLRDRQGRAGDRAARSSTTIATGGSICSSPTICRFDLDDGARAGHGSELPVEGRPGQLRTEGTADRHQPALSQRRRRHVLDVSDRSGIARVTGRYSMTAVAADLDDDGWPDIYVASDSTAAILYRNNHDGTFTDIAVESGAAYSEHGSPQAGMGVAVGDYNGDGRLDLAEDAFRRRHSGALSQSRQGPVRGCGCRRGSARAEPLRPVGHRA